MTTTKPEDTSATRWAIVGPGGIANGVMPELHLTEGVRVTAVYSRSRERAEEFAARWSIDHAYDDYDALLADPEIDVVYVCTPHTSHFEYSSRALSAGKNVLCEKPLTMNVADAVELQRLAEANRRFLMEAMWTKFNPNVQRALELIRDGAIGEVRNARVGMGFPVPPEAPDRFFRPELGGGALFDMGIYTVTVAQLFLGEPDGVTSVGRVNNEFVDLYEAAILSYDNGGFAEVSTSIAFSIDANASVGGTAGSLSFDGPCFAPIGFTLTTGGPPNPPNIERVALPIEGRGYVPMFRAVSDAVRAGRTSCEVHPVSFSIGALRTMEAIRDQLVAGR